MRSAEIERALNHIARYMKVHKIKKKSNRPAFLDKEADASVKPPLLWLNCAVPYQNAEELAYSIIRSCPYEPDEFIDVVARLINTVASELKKRSKDKEENSSRQRQWFARRAKTLAKSTKYLRKEFPA